MRSHYAGWSVAGPGGIFDDARITDGFPPGIVARLVFDRHGGAGRAADQLLFVHGGPLDIVAGWVADEEGDGRAARRHAQCCDAVRAFDGGERATKDFDVRGATDFRRKRRVRGGLEPRHLAALLFGLRSATG